MSLPYWGTLSISDIANEFGGSVPHSLSEYYRSGGYVTSNNFGVPTAGAISLSNFYGAVKVVPGSIDYTTPGTYTFIVPPFVNLNVKLWGGGGAGGNYLASYFPYGPVAGTSSFLDTYATGGTGGQLSGTDRWGGMAYGAGGPGGVAWGNTVAIAGNTGGDGGSFGYGAGAPYGGGNVTPGYRSNVAGSFPGGGGSGYYYDTGGKFPWITGGGGSGGYAESNYGLNQVAVGSAITVTVGAGGTLSPYGSAVGALGSGGRVILTWS